jgi:hypothetical protein
MDSICFPAHKKCYTPHLSYGEICVGCGCCGKHSKERTKNRLNMYQEMLEEAINFDQWAVGYPKLIEVQKKNQKLNVKYARRHFDYYNRKVKE